MKYISKMDHNTNRLNFPLMVDNHLKVTPRPHSIYFDSFTVPNNRATKSAPSLKTKHAAAARSNLESSLNSIYYTIHNSLKNKKMHRRVKQSVSQPHFDTDKAEPMKAGDNDKNNNDKTDTNLSNGINSKINSNSINQNNNNYNNNNNNINNNSYNKSKSKGKNNNINYTKASKYNSSIYNKFKFNNYANNNSKTNYKNNTTSKKPITTTFKVVKSTIPKTLKTTTTSKNNKGLTVMQASHEFNHNHQSAPRCKSIPQATIKCEQKHRQALTHTIHPYVVHQREAEVMRQKRILEEMLQEHQILETNRRSIKQEIQSMKVFINEIREKLDRSLLKLSENRTISSLSHKRNRLGLGVATAAACAKPTKNIKSNSAARTNNLTPVTAVRIDRRLKK